MTVLAADVAEAISFIFFGSPLEALISFLFFRLLEGVSSTGLLGSTTAEERSIRLALVYLTWPAIGRVIVGPLLSRPPLAGQTGVGLDQLSL